MSNKTLSQNNQELINQIISDQSGEPLSNIKPGSKLKDELWLDSLDCLEISFEIEKQLEIPITDEDLEPLQTVQDIYNLVASKVKEA